MTLSNTQIASLEPRERQYNVGDSPNLYLAVKPNGSKLWRMNYSFLGARKTAHLGQWPAVGPAEARERRDQAKKQLADGLNPNDEKKRARLAARISQENTFGSIAEEWFNKCNKEGRAPVTLRKIRWLIDIANPLIGSMPIADITAPHLLAALKRLEDRELYESATRMRSVAGRIFRYAIATGRAERDISADLRGALINPKPKHLSAITTPDGAGRLMRSIEAYHGSPVTRLAMLLSAHLFLRPGELRMTEWSEIDWRTAIWSIPAERTKMRRPHSVPLSRQAQLLIVELYKLTGRWKWVFPSDRRPRDCMSNNTVNTALRRMGYPREEMTAHGFRAMAATLLNETGKWHPDAIERQLAHLEQSEVRRAYTRGEHWDERIRMMQFWSDYLEELRDREDEVVIDPTVPNYMMLARGPAQKPALLLTGWRKKGG